MPHADLHFPLPQKKLPNRLPATRLSIAEVIYVIQHAKNIPLVPVFLSRKFAGVFFIKETKREYVVSVHPDDEDVPKFDVVVKK